jgi:hypothetical protein
MESEQIPPPPDAGDIVVFSVRKDTACAECGSELFPRSLIMLNKERNPLCLKCADLDHLEYLSCGNATLTRRASRLSRLGAVVVEWGRARHRFTNYDELLVGGYDRQEARAMGPPGGRSVAGKLDQGTAFSRIATEGDGR